MSYYGKTETWKVVYFPKELDAGRMGVALVEAPNWHVAMTTFEQEYAGQYFTVKECKKLLDD